MMFCDPQAAAIAILKLAFAGGFVGSLLALVLIICLGNLRSWMRTRAMYRSMKRRGLVR